MTRPADERRLALLEAAIDVGEELADWPADAQALHSAAMAAVEGYSGLDRDRIAAAVTSWARPAQ